jgi:hypothetical protein
MGAAIAAALTDTHVDGAAISKYADSPLWDWTSVTPMPTLVIEVSRGNPDNADYENGQYTWEQATALVLNENDGVSLPDLAVLDTQEPMKSALESVSIPALQYPDQECWIAMTENYNGEQFKKWWYLGVDKQQATPPPTYVRRQRKLHEEADPTTTTTTTTTTTAAADRYPNGHPNGDLAANNARSRLDQGTLQLTRGKVEVENAAEHPLDRFARTACLAYMMPTPIDTIGRQLWKRVPHGL